MRNPFGIAEPNYPARANFCASYQAKRAALFAEDLAERVLAEATARAGVERRTARNLKKLHPGPVVVRRHL